ncbi:MAG: hypothetical protein H7A35_13185 [Planctomycetales bacterium]|nr:hypothetical protein [bacterium]UNM07800.1 MAG: hypothetical protein H7A35_13185 [Planctomycetales bacterium]
MKAYENPWGFYLIGIPVSFAIVALLVCLILCRLSGTKLKTPDCRKFFLTIYLIWMIPCLSYAYVMIHQLDIGEGGPTAVAFFLLIDTAVLNLLMMMAIRQQLVHRLAVDKRRALQLTFGMAFLIPVLTIAAFVLSDFLTYVDMSALREMYYTPPV